MSRLSECGLRPILESDLDQILSWRNSARVREQMVHDQEISIEDHQKWFATKVKARPEFFWMFEYNAKPHGLVYISQEEKSDLSGYWGFYLGEVGRPKGLGTFLGILGLDTFFKFGFKNIIGEVKQGNAGSRAFHERLGFVEIETQADELDAFELTKDAWTVAREKLVRGCGE